MNARISDEELADLLQVARGIASATASGEVRIKGALLSVLIAELQERRRGGRRRGMTLEEVIAAALKSFDYIDVSDAHADAEEYEQISGRVAAAVREWCLAPQQIATAVEAIFGCVNFGDFEEVSRAVLQAVMGDTP